MVHEFFQSTLIRKQVAENTVLRLTWQGTVKMDNAVPIDDA
jgi:hypothetical protein